MSAMNVGKKHTPEWGSRHRFGPDPNCASSSLTSANMPDAQVKLAMNVL
jgi:hypothetical protein